VRHFKGLQPEGRKRKRPYTIYRLLTTRLPRATRPARQRKLSGLAVVEAPPHRERGHEMAPRLARSGGAS
jgi:hypothetical protein